MLIRQIVSGTSFGVVASENAAATWIFRGSDSRRRRDHDVKIPWGRGRGDVAAATWIFPGSDSRRRRDQDVDIPWPVGMGSRRRCGRDVDIPLMHRGGAAATTWIVREAATDQI